MLAKIDELAQIVARQGDELRALRLLQVADSKELLSKSAAARALGIGRSAKLLRLIEDGVLKTVRCGKRECISRDDIERVKRDGFVAVYDTKKKTRRKNKVAPAAESNPLADWRHPDEN